MSVCPPGGWRVYPSHHPIILPLQLIPCPFGGGGGAGYSHPASNRGYPMQFPSKGGTLSRTGRGYKTGWGTSPHSPIRTGWGNPAPIGTGWGYPRQDWMVYHPTCQDWLGYWVVLGQVMLRVVCLLWFPAGFFCLAHPTSNRWGVPHPVPFPGGLPCPGLEGGN